MKRAERGSRKLLMTPEWVKRVRPEAGPVEWRDEQERGLVLRIETSGRKTWTARYVVEADAVRREGRFVLGIYPALTLAAARVEARKAKGDAAKGQDPQAERRKARDAERRRKLGDTIAAAVASWLEDRDEGPHAGLGGTNPRPWKGGLAGGRTLLAERKKGEQREALAGTARSFVPAIRALARELGGKKVAALRAEDARRFVSGETKGATLAGSTRNHRRAVLRAFVAWARRRGLLEGDPTLDVRKQPERPRRRVLSDDELQALIHGFDATRFGPVVRALTLTACRRDEILGARWEWLDLDGAVLRLPAEATKEGDARGSDRLVALSPAAVALFRKQRERQMAEGARSEWIFASSTGNRPASDCLKPILYTLKGLRPNGRPASTDKRAKSRPVLLPADVRIHDVRRTVADALVNRLGVLPWLVDRVILAHHRSADEATYVPTLEGKPLDEARAALTAWATMLELLLAAKAEAQA